jgi:cbb3-type cytochrome oxidase subunit 3
MKAGLLAGVAAFALLQFLGMVIYDESTWKLPRMIAAMVRGPSALEPDDEFDAALVLIAMVLFFALSMLYSLALAALLSDSPRRYGALMGIASGIALYHANFYGFTAIFPWFASHRTIDTLVVHAFFGLLIVKTYWLFRDAERRGSS